VFEIENSLEVGNMFVDLESGLGIVVVGYLHHMDYIVLEFVMGMDSYMGSTLGRLDLHIETFVWVAGYC
jgi:hypothetical protein